MMPNHYISSTYLKILVQANKSLVTSLEIALGFSITELLRDSWVSGEDVNRIFLLFQQYGLDSWILRYGKQFGVASHGPLGFAVLSAPNLQTAIEVAADYNSTRLSFFDCTLKQTQSKTEYIFTSKTENLLTERWMVESGVHVIKQLIETIVAHPVGNNAKISFTYPEPDYKEELEAFYGVQCQFNATKNAVSIPTSWCQIRSPLSDKSTFKSNLQKCQELKLSLSSEQQLVDYVRFSLNTYFENQPLSNEHEIPNLSSLAVAKHISPRTLSRRLKEQGSNYKKILEEVRKKRACQLLKHTHKSIAVIATTLDYQEPANFIRAFKVWHNCTPTQWRKKQ